MNYLTTAQVLFIHARLIAETGGAPGIRDLGLLESAEIIDYLESRYAL